MDEIRFVCPVTKDEYIYSVERFRRKPMLKLEDMDYYFTLFTLRNGAIHYYNQYCREGGRMSHGDLVVIPKEDVANAKDYVIKWHKQHLVGMAMTDAAEEIFEKLESLFVEQ